MNTPERFYLLGAYWGDGHICYIKSKRGSSHQFSIVSEDRDFCQICSDIVYRRNSKFGTIKLVNNYYKLVVCSKDLCNSILAHTCSVMDYYSADRYQKKSRLPTFPGLEHKKSFIRGLMDSDGWISKRKNGQYIKYEVGFKNTSTLSPVIYDLMVELGLSCGKLTFREGVVSYRNGKQYDKNKSQWSWTITPRSYITTIGFSIARKKLLCQEFLKAREWQLVAKNMRDVAAELGVSYNRLSHLVKTGKLKCYRASEKGRPRMLPEHIESAKELKKDGVLY